MTINVQLVFGAGSNKLWGKGISQLRDKIIAEFGDDVFVPRVVDHTEYGTLLRLMARWRDPTVLIGHSCGVESITQASVEHSMKRFPYIMGIATSVFCRPKRLAPNVAKVTEVIANSNFFNPLKQQLIKGSAVNNTTEIETFYSGVGHVQSAEVEITHSRAILEIRNVIENHPPDFAGV